MNDGPGSVTLPTTFPTTLPTTFPMRSLSLILPTTVAVSELECDPPHAELLPGEEIFVARALPGRRREFTTTRQCARTALAQLGFSPAPILRGPRGEPQWPAGVVGSITHCAGYRAAVVARRTALHSLGIDAEPHAGLPPGVWKIVSLPAERAMLHELAAVAPQRYWDRIVFSVKESVYKAWYPMVNQWLDFHDVEVTLHPGSGSFSASILRSAPVPAAPTGSVVEGRFQISDGRVVTAAIIAAPPSISADRVDLRGTDAR